MKKKSDKWSIQISTDTASEIKRYCDRNGFKMNWFVETAAHLCITGSLIVAYISGSSYGK